MGIKKNAYPITVLWEIDPHLDVFTETSIEFDVPVGKLGTRGEVDDTLEEGATLGNYLACKLESAYKGLKFSEGGRFFKGPLRESLFGLSELVLWEAGLYRMGV